MIYVPWRAVTVTQPHASLIAIRAKLIETRGWLTHYRGPLAIHAAKGFPYWNQHLCRFAPVLEALSAAKNALPDFAVEPLYDAPHVTGLPLGAIVAVCELVDVCRIVGNGFSSQSKHGKTQSSKEYGMIVRDGEIVHVHPPEFHFGDYRPNRYAWILDKVRMLPEPIPCKGAQKLWFVPDGVGHAADTQLSSLNVEAAW